MQHTNLYIDGQWRDAASGERFDVINPATEETIASVASADLADADAALDAAQAAFADYGQRVRSRERARKCCARPSN
jgi:succinate-semialdehyde dehydrogenase/glutarate-semialdehyde dehydrogenase